MNPPLKEEAKEALEELDLIEEFDLKQSSPIESKSTSSSTSCFHSSRLYPNMGALSSDNTGNVSKRATGTIHEEKDATKKDLFTTKREEYSEVIQPVCQHLCSKILYPSLATEEKHVSQQQLSSVATIPSLPLQQASDASDDVSSYRNQPGTDLMQHELERGIAEVTTPTAVAAASSVMFSSELFRRQQLIEAEIAEYEQRMDYFAKALAGETLHQTEEKLRRAKEKTERDERRREAMEQRIQHQLERAIEREKRQLPHQHQP